MKDSQATEKLARPEEERLPDQAKTLGWVSRLSFIIAVALALAGLAVALFPRLQFFSQNTAHWLTYPYFQAGSEGLMLSEAAIIRAGGSLYVPLRPDLFISAPYPPLYYYLLAALWPSGSAAATGFTIGRAISLVSALVTAFLIVLLVIIESGAAQAGTRRLLRWWPGLVAGLAAGLLFLSMPAVAVWAARVRADMLMVALQLVGLVLIAWKPRQWPAFAAILPLTLALYTKHTGLAAPAAAAFFVVLQNWQNWRRNLIWLGAFGGAVGLPFVLLSLLTANEFYRRLFPYHDLGRDDRNFERYTELFWQENAALLVMSALLIVLTLVWWLWEKVGRGEIHWRSNVIQGRRGEGKSAAQLQLGGNSDKSRAQPPPTEIGNNTGKSKIPQSSILSPQSSVLNPQSSVLPLSAWFVLFSLPLLFGLGVVGTDHNHFLPGEAAGCAAAGVLVGRLLALPSGNKWRWLALVAIGGLWVQAAVCAVPAPRYEIEFRQRDPDYQRQLGQIVLNAAAQPKPILSSEAGFLALTNRPADHFYYNDLFTISALSRKGRYNLDGLLNAVRNKEFGLILAEGDFFTGREVRGDVWSPELVAAIKANYKLKFRDVWFVYEPRE